MLEADELRRLVSDLEDSLLVSSRLITNFPLRNSRSEIPASLSGGFYLSVSFVNLSFCSRPGVRSCCGYATLGRA